jgi:hypothetical protein
MQEWNGVGDGHRRPRCRAEEDTVDDGCRVLEGRASQCMPCALTSLSWTPSWELWLGGERSKSEEASPERARRG